MWAPYLRHLMAWSFVYAADHVQPEKMLLKIRIFDLNLSEKQKEKIQNPITLFMVLFSENSTVAQLY